MNYDKISSSIRTCAKSMADKYTAAPKCMINGFALKTRVSRFIDLIRTAMYPRIYSTNHQDGVLCESSRYNNLQQGALLLYEMLSDVMCFGGGCKIQADDIAAEFVASIPSIMDILQTDIAAAYEGDPAAKCEEEIMLSYPSFEAISIFRLAHRLTELGVPLLPRMMTECAHQRTGIDIHPGATIGNHFFIDHGTGVVIGETCVIGDRVKLYQGVTLGAKSFEADENGNPIKGIKRHPNIGNDVVIYAGATILGGNTYVGDGCIIGGNVWLTHSIDAGTSIYYDGEMKIK